MKWLVRAGLFALGLLLDWLAIPPGLVPAAILAADAPFLWLLFHERGRAWKRWAYLYGALHFGVSLWWVGHVNLAEPFVIAALLGLIYLVAGGFIRLAARLRMPWVPTVGAILVLEEFTRTIFLGGMPWPVRSMSFAGSDRLVASSCAFGAYGLSFVAAMSSAVVAGIPAVVRCPPEIRGRLLGRVALAALLPLGLTALLFLLGGNRIAAFERAQVQGRVVSTRPLIAIQGDVPQALKNIARDVDQQAGSGGQGGEEDADVPNRLFQRHKRLSILALEAERSHDPLAVLWPETMVPWEFVDPAMARRYPAAWANELRVLGHIRSIPPSGTKPLFLLGVTYCFARGKEAVEPFDANGTYDSLLLVDPDQLPAPGEPDPPPPEEGVNAPPWEVGRHDKHSLVPGGEYTPLGDLIPPFRRFRGLISPIPELDPGAEDQAPFLLSTVTTGEGKGFDVRAGTVICFELVFPARTRAWRRAGAHVLLNASNYGWFGETGMRAQIQALARLRAAETATTVVMAGNRGPTLFFDPVGRPYGRFFDAAGEEIGPIGDDGTTYRQGWATGNLLADPSQTPYVGWGDTPWFVLPGLLLGLTLLRRRRVVASAFPSPGSEPGSMGNGLTPPG